MIYSKSEIKRLCTQQPELVAQKYEQLVRMNVALKKEIELLSKPQQLTTKYPMLVHPVHLTHPEWGPIIQQKLQDGTALLSQPLCTECGGGILT